MSVKTFADPDVKKLLDEQFVFASLNVDSQRQAASWFAGSAIPDVRVLSLDGRMLDRIVGFMEPKEFAARLRRVLERR
jgi:thioredoxin-like negative regulator of GroEL